MVIMRYQRGFNLPTEIARMRLLEERFFLVDRCQLTPVWHATACPRSKANQLAAEAPCISARDSESHRRGEQRNADRSNRAISGTGRLEGETRYLKLWLRPPSTISRYLVPGVRKQ